MQQPNIDTYIRENHGVINIGIAEPATKRTVSATSKIDENLNDWANEIATAVAEATGDFKFGRSTVINDALRFYRHFFSYAKKMLKHKEKMIQFVSMLD